VGLRSKEARFWRDSFASETGFTSKTKPLTKLVHQCAEVVRGFGLLLTAEILAHTHVASPPSTALPKLSCCHLRDTQLYFVVSCPQSPVARDCVYCIGNTAEH